MSETYPGRCSGAEYMVKVSASKRGSVTRACGFPRPDWNGIHLDEERISSFVPPATSGRGSLPNSSPPNA